MERHFEKALASLGDALREMTNLCGESLAAAEKAFLEGSAPAAEPAFRNERRVNQLEIGIDQEVMEIFALHQPVAVDLRYILAIFKINNDLERVGDHAVNIAQSAVSCSVLALPDRLELPRMFELTRGMFHDACRGFFDKDIRTASLVLEADDMIDGLNKSVAREAVQRVKGGILSLEAALELMRIARNLERIGDLSTNIAEEVMFHVQAKVVKHRGDD